MKKLLRKREDCIRSIVNENEQLIRDKCNLSFYVYKLMNQITYLERRVKAMHDGAGDV